MEYRVFKTRHFARWMRKTDLSSENLCEGASEMQNGLIDADLGGSVVKKRVALPGRGKRSGARVLVGTNRGSKWFFIFGFEKNQQSNLENMELKVLQDVARDLLSLGSIELDSQLRSGSLQEICHENES